MTDQPAPLLTSLDRRSLLRGTGAAAVGLSLAGLAACAKKPQVNFLNWDTYIGETTLADFEMTGGMPVNMTFFANNDELFARFRGGNPGFDVIVPSDDAVQRMKEAKMLMPLDHGKIPNFANIAPEFKDVSFDPGRAHSMPYTWLVMGIGYRKSKVKSPPDSWKVIYDSDEYKGRIAMVGEAGDVFRIAARYLGYKPEEMTPALIKQIEPMLIKQKPNWKMFHDDNGQLLLKSGEVDLALEYNGDLAQVIREDPDLDFIIPKEGSQLNADNLAIPAGAPNPDAAHAFINYLLDAKAGRDIAETIFYPTPNAAAKALTSEKYRSNPVVFPPADALARCSYAPFRPDLQPLYEEALGRVKAA